MNNILTKYFIDNQQTKHQLEQMMYEIHQFSSQCMKVEGEYPNRKVIAKNVTNWKPFNSMALFCGEISLEQDVDDQSYSCGIFLDTEKMNEYVLDCRTVALQSAADIHQKILQDMAKKLGNAHILQHRCSKFNCKFYDVKFHKQNDYIMVPAIKWKNKSILPKEGEELTINYGADYVKTWKKWMEIDWVKQLLSEGQTEQDIADMFILCACDDCTIAQDHNKKYMIKHTPLQKSPEASEATGGYTEQLGQKRTRNRKKTIRWSYDES